MAQADRYKIWDRRKTHPLSCHPAHKGECKNLQETLFTNDCKKLLFGSLLEGTIAWSEVPAIVHMYIDTAWEGFRPGQGVGLLLSTCSKLVRRRRSASLITDPKRQLIPGGLSSSGGLSLIKRTLQQFQSITFTTHSAAKYYHSTLCPKFLKRIYIPSPQFYFMSLSFPQSFIQQHLRNISVPNKPA